jgi:predicted Fe-S protein YdhL (DUF1289 family)
MISPCTRLCQIERIEDGTKRCIGCKRTLAEIAKWGGMTDDERDIIMKDLLSR